MFITKYNDKVREALAFREKWKSCGFRLHKQVVSLCLWKSITIICLLEMDYETLFYFHFYAGRIDDY